MSKSKPKLETRLEKSTETHALFTIRWEMV
jgi:hypothetical protein